MTKVLGLIPARGGSKSLPGKNIRPLSGRSLVQRAWESARQSGAFDRVILSTDDRRIAAHGREIGVEVPFRRPAELAGDAAPMIDVAVHALRALAELDGYAPEAVMILQPTSPLRTPDHIRRAVSLLDGYEAVCSVLPLPRDLSPHYLMRIRPDGCLDFFLPGGDRFTRRQDVPVAYRREGTVFLTRAEVILEQRSFYGTRCRPMLMTPDEVLNIDTPEDWAEAVRRFGGEDR